MHQRFYADDINAMVQANGIKNVSELEKYVLPIASRYKNKEISISESVDQLHKYDIEIAEWLSNNREKFKNFLTRNSKKP